MRCIFTPSVLIALSLAAAVVHASPNVTANATVTLNGTFNNTGGIPLSSPQDLVNGVFQPEQTTWVINSESWYGTQNTILLNLNGTYSITGFTVQADNNDTYELDYLAPGSSSWALATIVPPFGPYGLNTRVLPLGSPILATELLFMADSGDGDYAVSQIDGTGSLVGAPDTASTLALTAFGLAALGLAGARKLQRA